MHNTNIPCGCIIDYEGDQYHQDYSINWCPLHAAAAGLLEACKQTLALRHGIPCGYDYERCSEKRLMAIVRQTVKEASP